MFLRDWSEERCQNFRISNDTTRRRKGVGGGIFQIGMRRYKTSKIYSFTYKNYEKGLCFRLFKESAQGRKERLFIRGGGGEINHWK